MVTKNGESSFLKLIIHNEISDFGPSAKAWYPSKPFDGGPVVNQRNLIQVGIKTISLMGFDFVSKESFTPANEKMIASSGGLTGIIPFADLNALGLSYFFAFKNREGRVILNTITVIMDVRYRSFLFKNYRLIQDVCSRFAEDVIKLNEEGNESPSQAYLTSRLEKIAEFINQLQREASIDDLMDFERKLKIIFAGLEDSGKTAFALVLLKKYSQIPKLKATKGVDIQNIGDIFGSSIVIWDFGGQKQYRDTYFSKRDHYIWDTDELFYFINVQDPGRKDDILHYFKEILDQFK
ncbi:MAG: ADP-ribosylation factor-like protein, partial [Promethearchaeota archaeon]